MPGQLDNRDRQFLLGTLRDLPDFGTFRGRQALIENAVGGYPKSLQLMGNIDWEGAAAVVANDVLRWFEGYEVADGVPALALLVSAVEPLVTAAQRAELRDLGRRYGWEAEMPAQPPAAWRDDRSTEALNLERVIGENTLRHINMLHKAVRAAAAVVRITVPDQGYGTGFMVAPDLVMTNHHVIEDAAQAAGAEFAFFYELDIQGRAREPIVVGAATDGLLHTDADLDFSLVRLQTPPDFGRPLSLKARRVEQDQRLAIIQHPGGFYKKVSMQNNFVAFADARLLQYYTSTEAGSSGSPVFNEDFEVVGIHRGYIELADPDPGQRYFRNQGSSTTAVLQNVQSAAPRLHDEITAGD